MKMWKMTDEMNQKEAAHASIRTSTACRMGRVRSNPVKSVRNPCKSVRSVSSVVYAFGRVTMIAPHRPRMTLIGRICADNRIFTGEVSNHLLVVLAFAQKSFHPPRADRQQRAGYEVNHIVLVQDYCGGPHSARVKSDGGKS